VYPVAGQLHSEAIFRILQACEGFVEPADFFVKRSPDTQGSSAGMLQEGGIPGFLKSVVLLVIRVLFGQMWFVEFGIVYSASDAIKSGQAHAHGLKPSHSHRIIGIAERDRLSFGCRDSCVPSIRLATPFIRSDNPETRHLPHILFNDGHRAVV
jgi:hypothetical protein